MLSFFFRQGASATRVMHRASLASSSASMQAQHFSQKEIFESIFGDSDTEMLNVGNYHNLVTITGSLKPPVWGVLAYFTNINLSGVNLQGGGFGLPANDKVGILNLNGTRLEHIDPVISVLRRCKALHSLDLSNNHIGNPDAMASLAALCRQGSLKTLTLRGNNLSKAGDKALDGVLTGLENLDLSATRLTAKQGQYLARLLSTNDSIVDLNLSSNPDLTPELKSIVKALENNQAIRTVNFYGCGKLTRELWQSILELINHCQTLEKIVLPEGNNNAAGLLVNNILKQRSFHFIDTSMPLPLADSERVDLADEETMPRLR